MAKVIGPLFSLAASGTYRGEIVFRTYGGQTSVSTKPVNSKERSVGQKDVASKVEYMSAAWSGLPGAVKNQWKSASGGTGKNGYQLFWSEWFIQSIVSPDLPLIP